MLSQERHSKIVVPMETSERLLMAVEGIVGVSAVICGLILPWNSLGMSTTLLDGSPFNTFLIPGLVLAVVVGGSLLVSAVAIWNRRAFARISSLMAGSILLGWIAVESWIVEDGRPLQLVILGFALFIIVTSLWRGRKSVTTSSRTSLRS